MKNNNEVEIISNIINGQKYTKVLIDGQEIHNYVEHEILDRFDENQRIRIEFYTNKIKQNWEEN